MDLQCKQKRIKRGTKYSFEGVNMLGSNEIILSGKYKGFNVRCRFDVNKSNNDDVTHILGHISSEVESHAYAFSGIDIKAIENFVKINGQGLAAVYEFLESRSSEWTKMMKENLNKSNPKLMSVADSYFFNQLLTKAQVPFKIRAGMPVKPENEEIEGQIAFIGRYDKWVAIKKIGLDNVKDYEISGLLSSINHTAINKAFELGNVKKDDAMVSSVASGKRKSYGNAVTLLKDLEKKIKCDETDAYIICKSLETLGYCPYATPGMLTAAYPDIKPPKVKGRKPKG